MRSDAIIRRRRYLATHLAWVVDAWIEFMCDAKVRQPWWVMDREAA